jgi:uncharacterized membrane protein
MGNSSQPPRATPPHSGSVYIRGEKYPLPQQVVDNIETVLGFQAKQEQQDPWHERLLTKIAAVFGTSYFLYAQILFFAVWMIWSHLTGDGTLPFNLPKYRVQDQFLDTAALLIATGVLVRQSRQEKLAEQRSHLMLQINLLTEQKTAKIIGLLEELRADLPTLQDRHDWEAEIMRQATDPQIVLNILQENLNSATETSEIPSLDVEQPSTQS